VVVSDSYLNELLYMNPDNTHKTMMVVLIIIGIILIIILLSPRGYSTYSYRGNAFTASALPMQVDVQPKIGTYSFVRYLPTRTTSTTTTTGSTHTSYSYPTTDYSYQTYDQGGTVFPDGCTLTSPYSTTTGLPCS